MGIASWLGSKFITGIFRARPNEVNKPLITTPLNGESLSLNILKHSSEIYGFLRSSLRGFVTDSNRFSWHRKPKNNGHVY